MLTRELSEDFSEAMRAVKISRPCAECGGDKKCSTCGGSGKDSQHAAGMR